MKKNDIDIDDDMSKTFIAEGGQKSAIADKDEVLEENTNESNFPDISIEPPKEEINTNEIGTNVEEKETKSGYEKAPLTYDKTKNKKSNPLVTILLMILSLAIGIGGSYYYFEIFNKDENSEKIITKKNNTKEEKTIDSEEISPDSVYIEDLISNYDFKIVSDIEIYDALYRSEKTEIKDLNEIYLRALAAIKANRNLGGVAFSSSDFQNAVTLLFGKQVNLEDKSIYDGKTCINVKYDNSSDIYLLGETACGGISVTELERKIVKVVKKDDDELKVNVAVAIINTEENKVYKNSVTNPDGTDGSELIENVTATTFDIDKDYSKLNQYQYTFKYDKDNSNYYLESIELIK